MTWETNVNDEGAFQAADTMLGGGDMRRCSDVHILYEDIGDGSNIWTVIGNEPV